MGDISAHTERWSQGKKTAKGTNIEKMLTALNIKIISCKRKLTLFHKKQRKQIAPQHNSPIRRIRDRGCKAVGGTRPRFRPPADPHTLTSET